MNGAAPLHFVMEGTALHPVQYQGSDGLISALGTGPKQTPLWGCCNQCVARVPPAVAAAWEFHTLWSTGLPSF